MAKAKLTISSKNYSSWSLRGWLLCKFSGLDFEEVVIPPTHPNMRAELLLLSPSMLVPALRHDELVIWNNLAIGEYDSQHRNKLVPIDFRRNALGFRAVALRSADESEG